MQKTDVLPIVLVVDDDALIRFDLAEALAEAGYRVLEAGSVLEAIAVLGQGPIDALVTDIDMPGALNGLDLARLVAAMGQGAALLVVSGGRRPGAAELPAGARFLPKPYAHADILAEIGRKPGAMPAPERRRA